MRTAIGLLCMSALALSLASLWPRAGHPVLLAFPAGAAVGSAFGVEGWRVSAISEVGPFQIVFAVPEEGAPSPTQLGAGVGALMVLAARPMATCAPASRGT